MLGSTYLALALAVSLCEAGAVPPDVPLLAAVCPAEPVLELLHEAAFRLDRGENSRSVGHVLAEARRLLRSEEPGAAWASGFIVRMEATMQSDAATRRFGAEVIRADLHESICLQKDLHHRFHQRLSRENP